MRISNLVKALTVLTIVTITNNVDLPPAEAAFCKGGQGIGVSRTITLKTSGGARYGSSHGGHRNFLRDKEVVLTFDDGPIPSTTSKVLHELDRHCAKATFFMVGQMAKNNPKLVRRVLKKGHTVGIHSYSHRDLGKTNAKTAILEVDRSIKAIHAAAGKNVSAFFRFPYLSENQSVNGFLRKNSYGVFAVDVDSKDYRFSNSHSMVNRVMSELKRKGKGIILLHDIKKVTANGIGELLDRLHEGGYKIVHIKGRGGKTVTDPLVMASNEESVRKTFKKPSIGVSFDRTGAMTSTFNWSKANRRKSFTGERIEVVSLSRKSKKQVVQPKAGFRVKYRKRAFRAAIKGRLITQ
ncbi:MAG: polysaccharide deacetylase family protein [Rhizobiaceae bacterium]